MTSMKAETLSHLRVTYVEYYALFLVSRLTDSSSVSDHNLISEADWNNRIPDHAKRQEITQLREIVLATIEMSQLAMETRVLYENFRAHREDTRRQEYAQ